MVKDPQRDYGLKKKQNGGWTIYYPISDNKVTNYISENNNAMV